MHRLADGGPGPQGGEGGHHRPCGFKCTFRFWPRGGSGCPAVSTGPLDSFLLLSGVCRGFRVVYSPRTQTPIGIPNVPGEPVCWPSEASARPRPSPEEGVSPHRVPRLQAGALLGDSSTTRTARERPEGRGSPCSAQVRGEGLGPPWLLSASLGSRRHRLALGARGAGRWPLTSQSRARFPGSLGKHNSGLYGEILLQLACCVS